MPKQFSDLPISAEVLRACEHMGFEEATPIQYESIPPLLEDRDFLGQAQTGTGKTCAFGIPLIERVDPAERSIQYLILSPTRELAIQIAEQLHELTMYKEGVRILPIYGGQAIDRQIMALKKSPQIIVGTPGRVMDHMRRKTIRIDNLKGIVLDEADEMLNMGFKEDIDTILAQTSPDIQKVFFSATMPPLIRELTEKYLHDPVVVNIQPKALVVNNIEQAYIEVRESNKLEVLCRLIDADDIRLALIFCKTKRRVDELVDKLNGRGLSVEGLHGDMNQRVRTTVMNRFKKGEVELLVATDVAARGIDVDDIQVVINYDLPQDEEYYVHRIGRTGRAGKSGKSYTFVVGREIMELKYYAKQTKSLIKCMLPPTLHEITEAKVRNALDRAAAILQNEDVSNLKEAIESYTNELNITAGEGEYYSSTDLAAAFLKDALNNTVKAGEEIEPVIPFEQLKREKLKSKMSVGRNKHANVGNYLAEGLFFEGDDEEEEAKPKRRRSKERDPEPGMVRMFVNVGSDDKAEPKHFVEAFCKRSAMIGKEMGRIAIFDRYTFVDVPKEHVRDILRGFQNSPAKIGRRMANVEESGNPTVGKRAAGGAKPEYKGRTKPADKSKFESGSGEGGREGSRYKSPDKDSRYKSADKDKKAKPGKKFKPGR